jgi:hypothetical protein
LRNYSHFRGVARLYGRLFGAGVDGREYPLFSTLVSAAVVPQGCAPSSVAAGGARAFGLSAQQA